MSREMKQSGIEWVGDIPSSWKVERLQCFLEEVNEKNNPIKTTNILSLTNKLGVVPYSKKGNQGNVAKENYEEYKLAFPDTIVANSMNILIGSVGYCNYFGCVSPVYYVYRNRGIGNLRFWNYLFQTQQFQKELRRYANGILEIRLRVSSSDILKRYVAVPSEIEQQKIVEIVDKKINNIEKLICNQERQIDLLKEQLSVLIKNKISFNSTGYEYPKIKFKKLALLSNGKEIDVEGGEIPVYGSGGIFKYTDRPLYDGISILMGRKGSIDNPMIVDGKFWTVDTMFYTSQIYDNVIPKFLYYAVKEGIDYNYYKSGSVLPSMTQTEINNILLPLPSIAEQKNIIKELDSYCIRVNHLIELKQEKIEKLIEYKKSIMYEYVTGKKEVV